MCGVIFGEWRGEDPADRDMPKIENKKKHYFKRRECSIHWLQSSKGEQHPKRSVFVSTCGALHKRELPDLLNYTISELHLKLSQCRK